MTRSSGIGDSGIGGAGSRGNGSGPAAIRHTGIRQLAAGVLSALPLVALLAVAAGLGPRLGATIASHWPGSGVHPNGFSSTWGSFGAFTAITAVLLAASIVAVVTTGRAAWSRLWVALAATVGGFTACAWIASAWATAAAPRPGEAVLGWRLAVMALALACGVAIYLLLPASPAPVTAQATRPTMPLAAGDRVSWTGTSGSRTLEAAVGLLGAIFVGSVILAVVARSSGAWISVVVFFLATLSSLLLVPVRVTVDQRGIRLSSALLRVPLIRVRLDNVESVAADTIEPAQWGGWGYRVSGSGIAYVARRGPGIVISRRSGGSVAITIDHPEQPAAVANALIAPRRLPGG